MGFSPWRHETERINIVKNNRKFLTCLMAEINIWNE
jgi:hypothetical protein